METKEMSFQGCFLVGDDEIIPGKSTKKNKVLEATYKPEDSPNPALSFLMVAGSEGWQMYREPKWTKTGQRKNRKTCHPKKIHNKKWLESVTPVVGPKVILGQKPGHLDH